MTILRGPNNIQAKEIGGGILTPATLGQPFINRLSDEGVHLETKLLDS